MAVDIRLDSYYSFGGWYDVVPLLTVFTGTTKETKTDMGETKTFYLVPFAQVTPFVKNAINGVSVKYPIFSENCTEVSP